MKTLIVMLESPVGWRIEATYSTGTAAVSAYAKQKGHKVICLNLNRQNNDKRHSRADRIYNFVKAENPDVVAVGGLVTDWKQIKEVCDMAKAAKPDIIAIIGGGAVDYSPSEAMSIIGVADFGVIGEGEVTFHELLTAIEKHQPVESIDGLIIRNSLRELITTQKRDAIDDIDSLPFLDYEGFGLFDEINETKSFSINSARSCPFSCTYCTHSGGGKYRQFSLNRLFEEINFVISHVPCVKLLSISDELFAMNEERLAQFVERIAPYGLKWILPMRANSIKDSEVFKKVVNAGGTEMQVGLESGCDLILKSMRKGISKAMLRELYQNAEISGIRITSSMIFGDIEETIETVEESFLFAKEILEKNKNAQISFFMIILYPGSPLYSEAKISGVIADTTKYILEGMPYINVSKMTDSEYSFLLKRTTRAMTKYFYVRNTIGLQRAHSYARQADDDNDKSYTYLRIADIDKKSKKYSLTYTCPKCGEVFFHEVDTITYGLEFEYSALCPVCLSKHYADNKIFGAMLLDDIFFQAIYSVLKEFIKCGNVGITGTGLFFACYRMELKRIFDELEKFSEYKFILSDGDPDIADKSIIIGRTVYSRDSVGTSVKNVVVTAGHSQKIKEEICKQNPQINVFDLFELPFLSK